MTDAPKDQTTARKIEKGRSWKQIASTIDNADEPLAEDYSTELDLFENGDVDKHLWAKCLVQADGDTEKAKWQYIKDRVTEKASNRAENQRKEQERLAALEAEKHRVAEAAEENRKRVADEEAKKLQDEKETAEKIEAQKQREKADLEFVIVLTCMMVFVFMVIAVLLVTV